MTSGLAALKLITTMERKFTFSVGEYYHLFSRGTARQKIFLDQRDYQRFLVLLYVSNAQETIHASDLNFKKIDAIFTAARGDTLTDIGAYCLMPNHFHLLVREKSEKGVSLFLRKLLTGYSMYFNKKYQRPGSLFGHPFGAQPVADDRHLKYLFAYIHLNPVKITDPTGWAGKRIADPALAQKFLKSYRFSSYFSYVKDNPCQYPETGAIVAPAAFPDYFSGTNDFQGFIDDWIEDGDANVKDNP